MNHRHRHGHHDAGHEDANVCPLTMAPLGQELRLCQLCEGRRVARRLAELGLTPGVCLRVVQDAGGPLLLSVRNSRVALGRGIADKLHVEVLPQADQSSVAADAASTESGSSGHSRWRWRRGAGHHAHGRHEHGYQQGQA